MRIFKLLFLLLYLLPPVLLADSYGLLNHEFNTIQAETDEELARLIDNSAKIELIVIETLDNPEEVNNLILNNYEHIVQMQQAKYGYTPKLDAVITRMEALQANRQDTKLNQMIEEARNHRTYLNQVLDIYLSQHQKLLAKTQNELEQIKYKPAVDYATSTHQQLIHSFEAVETEFTQIKIIEANLIQIAEHEKHNDNPEKTNAINRYLQEANTQADNLKLIIQSELTKNQMQNSFLLDLHEKANSEKINDLLFQTVNRIQRLRTFYHHLALFKSKAPAEESDYRPSLAIENGAEFSNIWIIARLLNHQGFIESDDPTSPIFTLLINRLKTMGYQFGTTGKDENVYVLEDDNIIAKISIDSKGNVIMQEAVQSN